MTTPAKPLDRVVASAVNRVFAELERRSPIDAMHDFLRKDSRFPQLGYLECQLTFDFLLAIQDDIEDVLRDRLADVLRDELGMRDDSGRSFKDKVRNAVVLALEVLFPDGKITPAAEQLFWIAFSLIAYENGSRDVAHAVGWVKHLLSGLDAPPPPPSSPPPSAATVVPFKRPIKRRAKKGK